MSLTTAGFWSTQNTASMTNNNFGFYSADGRYYNVNFPTGNNASPQVDQLLGVNDHDVAVGFYTNAQGNNRGYTYNILTHAFTRILVPGAPVGEAGPSLTATAINNDGDVAGFYAKSSSLTDAFLRLHSGRFVTLAVPGASMAVFAIIDAASERAGGVAAYQRAAPEHGSVEVGHIALSPRLQRTVAATEAMALMMGHVFNVLGYRRYEWKCDALNLPSRRAAKRLGFTYEGTFRQAVVVKGRNRDTAWFSVTDGEWQLLEPAFAAWLAPANFDALGQQRQSLSALTAEALASTPSP